MEAAAMYDTAEGLEAVPEAVSDTYRDVGAICGHVVASAAGAGTSLAGDADAGGYDNPYDFVPVGVAGYDTLYDDPDGAPSGSATTRPGAAAPLAPIAPPPLPEVVGSVLSARERDKLAALAEADRDWNGEFQALLDASPPQLDSWAHTKEDRGGIGGRDSDAKHADEDDASAAPTGDDDGAPDDVVHFLNRVHALVADFEACATAAAQAIVIESVLNVPATRRVIKPVNAGGIAGGEKFVFANVFLKRVHDVNGIYGGEDGAAAAAAHELRGARAYFDARIPGLRPPLLALVEFIGFRVLCSAVLPVGKDTLVYGSDDAGRTVHADSEVTPLMDEAGRRLNLKSHIVGATPSIQVPLCAPCDIEVHRGTDARLYVLDTARVMPPEKPDPPGRVTAVLIPASGGRVMRPFKLDFAAPGAVESDEPVWVQEVQRAVGGAFSVVRIQSPGGLDGSARTCARMCMRTHASGDDGLKSSDSDKGTSGPKSANLGHRRLRVNHRASALVGYPVRGPVVWFKPRVGAHLFRMLRPELVRASATPLSSDAFTRFGIVGAAEHNSDAAAASELVQAKVEELAHDIATGTVSATSNHEALRTEMHARGIGMRHLARLRDALHFSLSRDRSALLTEMVARYVKSVLRSRLRRAALETGRGVSGDRVSAGARRRARLDGALKAAATQVLGLVFGTGPAADQFWRVEVTLGLHFKYSGALSMDELKNPEGHPHVIDPRVAMHNTVLLSSILASSGVGLKEAALSRMRRDPTSLWSTPFIASDVSGFGGATTLVAFDSVDVMRQLRRLRASLVQVTGVFGNVSPEAAVASLEVASRKLLRNNDAAGAWSILEASTAACDRFVEVSSDAAVGVLFLRGRVREAMGDSAEAARLYEQASKALATAHGNAQGASQVVPISIDPVRGPEDDGGGDEYEDDGSDGSGDGDGGGGGSGAASVPETHAWSHSVRGHPFNLVLLDRICQAQEASGTSISVIVASIVGQELMAHIVPFDDRDVMARVFGAGFDGLPRVIRRYGETMGPDTDINEWVASFQDSNLAHRAAFVTDADRAKVGSAWGAGLDVEAQEKLAASEHDAAKRTVKVYATQVWRREVGRFMDLSDPLASGMLAQVLERAPAHASIGTHEDGGGGGVGAGDSKAAADDHKSGDGNSAKALRDGIKRARFPHLYPPVLLLDGTTVSSEGRHTDSKGDDAEGGEVLAHPGWLGHPVGSYVRKRSVSTTTTAAGEAPPNVTLQRECLIAKDVATGDVTLVYEMINEATGEPQYNKQTYSEHQAMKKQEQQGDDAGRSDGKDSEHEEMLTTDDGWTVKCCVSRTSYELTEPTKSSGSMQMWIPADADGGAFKCLYLKSGGEFFTEPYPGMTTTTKSTTTTKIEAEARDVGGRSVQCFEQVTVSSNALAVGDAPPSTTTDLKSWDVPGGSVLMVSTSAYGDTMRMRNETAVEDFGVMEQAELAALVAAVEAAAKKYSRDPL